MKGQESAKRALEIAAAGGHNAADARAARVRQDHAGAPYPGDPPAPDAPRGPRGHGGPLGGGCLPPGSALVTRRPFRAPHHTVSDGGMVGGGVPIRAGRGLVGASRRALPGRAGGVPAQRPGDPAPAAGGRCGAPLTRPRGRAFPGALSPGGGDEPLPLRVSRAWTTAVSATRRRWRAIRGGCRGRSWTVWTCRSRSRRPPSRASRMRAAESRPRWCGNAGRARPALQAERFGRLPGCTPTARWTWPRFAACVAGRGVGPESFAWRWTIRGCRPGRTTGSSRWPGPSRIWPASGRRPEDAHEALGYRRIRPDRGPRETPDRAGGPLPRAGGGSPD